jgi:hypothetical protein
MYVTAPHCAIADVRWVEKDGLARSTHSQLYDMPVGAGLETSPAVALRKEEWVKARRLIGRLSFIKVSAKWGQAFRNSFRSITARDAQTILAAMRASTSDAAAAIEIEKIAEVVALTDHLDKAVQPIARTRPKVAGERTAK